jgi:hypothetical protein
VPNDPEVESADEVSVGEDQCALDGVLQFTDVAGPLVHEQELASLFAEVCLAPSHPFREFAKEVVGQYEDVILPLPQGGKMNTEDSESKDGPRGASPALDVATSSVAAAAIHGAIWAKPSPA